MEIVLLPYRETIEDVGNGYNSLKFKKVLKIKAAFLKLFKRRGKLSNLLESFRKINSILESIENCGNWYKCCLALF